MAADPTPNFVVASTMRPARRAASIVRMSTIEVREKYSLGRTPEEYERLRAQARVWEAATGRLLDRVGLASGARCLDAGCGPGETMRLLAQRVGPFGEVLGIDVDADLGQAALAMLHRVGHRRCRFRMHDVTADAPIPGAPFDLVYARLLLFHLPQRVEVLARLWDAVAPGGRLLIQDYDLRSCGVVEALASADEGIRVVTGAFEAAGCDVRAGARLPQLFARAGIGAPDGTDVAGRLEPLVSGREILERTFRSVLPAALAHGVTTEAHAAALLAQLDDDAILHADEPMLWPLLVSAWKRRP
jgi:SAM-dependent methyltransferase